MAIADRLNKLRTDIEDTYQAITEIGGTIPSDKNTNNIPEAIRSVYDNLPKVSNTGTNVSLSPSLKGRLGIVPKGNTYQETTTGINYFNALEIPNNTNIVVEDDGKTIKMPIATSGNGITSTSKILSDLCPTLKVGDEVYLYFNRNLGNTYNDFIYLGSIQVLWYIGAKKTITQEMLDSNVSLYGNRATSGETTQCILTDFRIVKNYNDEWEKFTYGASPNPDYPQEIQSATGTQKVVVSGKNLFDKNNVERIYAYIQDNTTWRYYNDSYSIRIPVKPNTNYVISADNSNETIFRAGVTDSSDIPVSGTNVALYSTTRYSNTNTPIYITTGANAKYIVIQVAEDSANDTFNTLQVEKGNTATPYQPYQEPQEVDIELSSIELNKIGDYEDYIDGTPDNWVLYKNVEKTVITESNKNIITSFGTQNEHNRILINKTDLGWKTSWNSGVALLNKYKEITSASSVNTGTFATNFTQGALTIWNDNFTDLTTAQNLLIGTEILITKAEPQQTPITEEPLVSQLNELYYLQSYNDTTNIDVTGNLPMRITASAIKGA